MKRHSNLTATYKGNSSIPLNGKRTGSDLGGKGCGYFRACLEMSVALLERR